VAIYDVQETVVKRQSSNTRFEMCVALIPSRSGMVRGHAIQFLV